MNIVPPRTTTFSSRQFNQDTAGAKRAAQLGPVFITDRGKPTHVLMTKAEYDRAFPAAEPEKKPFVSLADVLADPRPEADFDWEPPRLDGTFFRVPDLD